MNRQTSKIVLNLLLVVFTVVALDGLTNSASADEYSRINRLAVKIRNQTRTLIRETEHYRFTANYPVLVSDSAELRQLAEHTREVARHQGDLDRLAAVVAGMDRTFHHLENLFDSTELLASQCQGSVKGHTAHVKRLLNSIEDCIHDIQHEIKKLRNAVIVSPAVLPQPPVILQRPVVEACPYEAGPAIRPYVTKVETIQVPSHKIHRHDRNYNSGGFSFSFGGGSSRMIFNF